MTKNNQNEGIKMHSTAPVRIAKIGYITVSVIFCIVGILFISRPNVSIQILSTILGAIMIIFGGIKITGYFSKDLFRLAFQYDLELGIILAILGIIVILNPFETIAFIFIATGIAILVDSIFKIRIAIDAKNFGIDSWRLIVVLALITSAIGILLIFRPWDSAAFLTIILGVSLLSEGILNIFVAVDTVKIINHQYPDAIEYDLSFDDQEVMQK